MVTSVNGSTLAALLAQEQALANRTQTASSTANAPADPGAAQDPAVVYSGTSAPSLSAILSVQDSLNRAASIADVGVGGGKSISDLLAQARALVAAAQGATDPDTKTQLDGAYQSLLQQIDQTANSASFQGVNLLDGSAGQGDLQFSAGLGGDAVLSLTPQDFTTGGPVLGGLAGTDLTGSADDLASLLGQVDAASGALSAQLSQMTGQSDQVQAQLGVVGQLQSSLGGDGDMSAESAKLQALSIQQMLSAENNGVANQAPQALLSLFR
jgi:flagellin